VPRSRAEELLDAVGLAGDADRRVDGYSLGMRQRLGLAHALLGTPDVLILDEPAANLDPPARAILFALLERRRDDTMIVSSHRVDEVAGLGTRIVELDRGRVVFDDPLILSAGERNMLSAWARIARPDTAFAKAMLEWGFAASEGGLAWRGAVAGPDRLRFLGLLSRYAGLLSGLSFNSEAEEERRHEAVRSCV